MSDHFSLIEFTYSKTASERNIDNTPPDSVITNLNFTMAGMERIRHALNEHQIQVLSGYRCPDLNQAVGGVENSQHVTGQACDFICPDFGTPFDIVFELIREMKVLGIDQMIMEGTWVHVSFTHTPRYQVMTLKDGKYLDGLV